MPAKAEFVSFWEASAASLAFGPHGLHQHATSAARLFGDRLSAGRQIRAARAPAWPRELQGRRPRPSALTALVSRLAAWPSELAASRRACRRAATPSRQVTRDSRLATQRKRATRRLGENEQLGDSAKMSDSATQRLSENERLGDSETRLK